MLAPGWWADMVLVDMNDPVFVLVLSDRDPIAHRVLSALRLARG